MFFLKNKYLGFIICSLSLLMASCGSEGDINPGNPSKEEPAEENAENQTRVALEVPVTYFTGQTSRGGEEVSEGWLSNLYLIVIKDGTPENASTGFNVYELDTSGTNPKIGDEEPTVFYVNLYPGTYRLYMIANFNKYLTRFTSISRLENEGDLKDIVLNFKYNMPLETSHLPMVCMPEEFSDNEGYFADGKLTIPDFSISNGEADPTPRPQIRIDAPLKFMCTKVRYTILYDNTVGGISQKFGNNSIRFIVNQSVDRPYVENIRKQTSLIFNRKADGIYDKNNFYIMDANDENRATWILNLNRYKFPENGAAYPESSSDDLIPWEYDPDLRNWKKSEQRAWQGVVYLPENNPSAEEGYTIPDLTILKFPYVVEKYVGDDGEYEEIDMDTLDEVPCKSIQLFGGNNKEEHYGGDSSGKYDTSAMDNSLASKGLKRGYFYDVVAKVVNPDEKDLELFIQVKVSDNPWLHHTNTQPEW